MGISEETKRTVLDVLEEALEISMDDLQDKEAELRSTRGADMAPSEETLGRMLQVVHALEDDVAHLERAIDEIQELRVREGTIEEYRCPVCFRPIEDPESELCSEEAIKEAGLYEHYPYGCCYVCLEIGGEMLERGESPTE